MENQTLPKHVQDCLKGWCLDESCLSEDDRELLLEAADYKTTRYAIVDKEKIEGLQKLGLLYIAPNADMPKHPRFLFRNGAFPYISMAQDFIHTSVVLVYFQDKDLPAANKMWSKFFKEDEFQNMYNGLVSLICRAIAFRRPENPRPECELHLQIAAFLIYG